MKLETTETPEGTRIDVETDGKVAVVVRGDGERIYLPETGGSSDSYYVENTEKLVETEKGWSVIHAGEIQDIKIIN